MKKKQIHYASLNFIAILFGFSIFIITFEILSRIIGVSDYIEYDRPVVCNDIDKVDLNCFRKRKNSGTYIKGSLPPFPINSKKRINDIGQLSDLDFDEFINYDNPNYLKVLSIGDSMVEALQVNNENSFHGKIHNKSLNNGLKIKSTIIAASGMSFANYIKSIEFASRKRSLKNVTLIIPIMLNDWDDAFIENNSVKGKFYYGLDGDFYFIPLKERSFISSFNRNLIKYSSFVRYLAINLEVRGVLQKYPFCKIKNNCFDPKQEQTNSKSPNKISEGFLASNLFIRDLKRLRTTDIERKNTILLFDTNRQKIYNPELSQNSFLENQRKFLIEVAKEEGFNVINLEKTFKNNYLNNQRKFEFINDMHWNEYGHDVVAKDLINFFNQQY